jgi:hypothetical protein
MHADTRALATFFLTGNCAGEELGPLAGRGLRPALFAAYRDLALLRYDFPLVLVPDAPPEATVASLTAQIDRAVDQAGAQGADGERFRVQVRRLEREVRVLLAAGKTGSLGALLDTAAGSLGGEKNGALAENVRRLRASLTTASEVLDCSAAMPARLFTHVFASVQKKKATGLRTLLERLIVGLRDILAADFARSEAGRTPELLRASVGAVHRDDFDFQALSRMLSKVSSKTALSHLRRRRIESALAVLESQPFCPVADVQRLDFHFSDCASALRAFRERLPGVAQLASAVAIAELELAGEFNHPRHDALFEQLRDSRLDVRDMGRFPDYLVCMNAKDLDAAQYEAAVQILSGALPVKILLQTDDILGEPSTGTGQLPVAARNLQLAHTAIGLGEVYVLQAAASHLPAARERVLAAMQFAGPALISTFSGANAIYGDLPPYLVSAAAMESRAFPAFVYDPSAGRDWASRFSLEGNPQPERDWPVHELSYEGAERRAATETLAFSLLDFMTCDTRYAAHFAHVPGNRWNGSLAPAAECLEANPASLPERLPCLVMVNASDHLQKVIVEGPLMRQARRCRESWHSLQELGGIHNSHTERALARERDQAAAAHTAAANSAASARIASTAPASSSPTPVSVPQDAAVPETEQKSSDEAYIETPRCSTCEECIQINNRMFAYDANKQAYIADINAGTYRELVEAAENCQVAIIHPGKPRNPSESDLDELMKRAETFL